MNQPSATANHPGSFETKNTDEHAAASDASLPATPALKAEVV